MASFAPKASDVLSQIGDYFNDLGFSKSLHALTSEARERGIHVDADGWARLQTSSLHPPRPTKLLDFWDLARNSTGHASLDLPRSEDYYQGDAQHSESEDSENEDADSAESDSDDSDSDDSSDGDGDASARAGQKRKRVLTPDSSSDSSSNSVSDSDNAMAGDNSSGDSSESDSDSEEEETDQRPSKRTKLSSSKKSRATDGNSSDSSSDNSTSDSSDDEEADDANDSSSSDSDSNDSDSESDSNSDSDSDSEDSSSDEASESSKSPSPPPKKKDKKSKKSKSTSLIPPNPMLALSSNQRTDSPTSSSETLPLDSPGVLQADDHDTPIDTLVIEDAQGSKEVAATRENIRKLKREQVPFSRIPANQTVDPRFASNAYVPYDYADRAYRDLVVTKGKGFTKEKNKKKRGESASSKKGRLQNHAAKRDPTREHLEEAFSGSHDQEFEDGFESEYNPFGFKEDTWNFMAGCGFNPLRGGW